MAHAQVRVGLVGCGPRAAASILPALRAAGADLVAIQDGDGSHLEALVRDSGARRGYADGERLIERELLDLLVVGDAADGLALAFLALDRDCPVLFGVGTDLTADEATRLATLSRERGLPVGMVTWTRFDAATRDAIRRIGDRASGRPLSTVIHAVRSVPGGHDGLPVMLRRDFLPALDAALELAAGLTEPAVVQYRSEEAFQCAVAARSSAAGTVVLDLVGVSRGRSERWTIEHTAAHGRVSLTAGGVVEEEHWEESYEPHRMGQPRRADMTLFDTPNRVMQAYRSAVQAFMTAVQDGLPYPASVEVLLPALVLAEELAGVAGHGGRFAIR